MRFGVFLLAAQFPGQDHTTVLDSSVAAAVAAEEAGFDDVWVAEHHFISYGICPSAITLAGYLLGATRRIEVGTAVSVLSTQHPVGLAEQALLLDQPRYATRPTSRWDMPKSGDPQVSPSSMLGRAAVDLPDDVDTETDANRTAKWHRQFVWEYLGVRCEAAKVRAGAEQAIRTAVRI